VIHEPQRESHFRAVEDAFRTRPTGDPTAACESLQFVRPVVWTAGSAMLHTSTSAEDSRSVVFLAAGPQEEKPAAASAGRAEGQASDAI